MNLLNFPERLKSLRLLIDLSQDELGKIFGLSQVSISTYENGAREPDISTLIKYSKFFKVSIDYLLGLSDIKNPYIHTSNFGEIVQTSKTSKELSSFVKAPLFSTLIPQEPFFLKENIEDYIYLSLNTSFTANNCPFGIKVPDDSMVLSHMPKGSIAIIQPQDSIKSGDIALLVIDNQDIVVRHFYKSESIITISDHAYRLNSPLSISMSKHSKSNIRIIGKVITTIFNYDS